MEKVLNFNHIRCPCCKVGILEPKESHDTFVCDHCHVELTHQDLCMVYGPDQPVAVKFENQVVETW